MGKMKDDAEKLRRGLLMKSCDAHQLGEIVFRRICRLGTRKLIWGGAGFPSWGGFQDGARVEGGLGCASNTGPSHPHREL